MCEIGLRVAVAVGSEDPVEPDLARDADDSGSGTANHRLTLRAPHSEGAELVRATKQTTAIRSARKSSGSLRIRVNPADLG